METVSNILGSPQFWGLATPIIAAVVAWLLNEHSKRSWDRRAKREQRYSNLVASIEGFYVSSDSPREEKSRFLRELNESWLYCPDEVIRKAYQFLDTVKVGVSSTADQKEAAYGELMLAIRQDLLNPKLSRKTKLKASDYKHLMVTK